MTRTEVKPEFSAGRLQPIRCGLTPRRGFPAGKRARDARRGVFYARQSVDADRARRLADAWLLRARMALDGGPNLDAATEAASALQLIDSLDQGDACQPVRSADHSES